jgi:putative nucleotidyltransferase with HDIG domain
LARGLPPRLVKASWSGGDLAVLKQDIAIIHDQPASPDDVRRMLGALFRLREMQFDLWREAPGSAASLVVSLHYEDAKDIAALAAWKNGAHRAEQLIIVGADSLKRKLAAVGLLSDAVFIRRPIESGELLGALLPVTRAAELREAARSRWFSDRALFAPSISRSIADGERALDDIFKVADGDSVLEPSLIKDCAYSLVEGVKEADFSDWIAAVRQHHDSTYQHCLLVTGVASAFAVSLGFSAADQNKVAAAALLHDIGKAHVPLHILDKPAALTAEEMVVMRGHSVSGAHVLSAKGAVDADVLAAVRHHHEHLDGTGYPDRLAGPDIGDLTRIITISDVFGALVERRAYKPPMQGAQAYDVMARMGDKLDRALVGVFHKVALQLA